LISPISDAVLVTNLSCASDTPITSAIFELSMFACFKRATNSEFDTLIPRAYKEMADHYNTAIVPVRVKHPDDKSNAEGSVKYATTWILAALRNYHFFSIEEAKTAVSEKLEEINLHPFKKRLGNRRSAFEDEEREFMLPLPKAHYEPAV